MLRQTFEIPVRDYTMQSNRVRPYDLKAPKNLLYNAIYNTLHARVYTVYYRLYSVYMVYLYTIARPLKGGNQVLHTSLRAMWGPDYSILYYSIVCYSIV